MPNNKQFIDYQVIDSSTTDTGEGDASAIRPISNGEEGVETVFRRPSDNLRTRTEVVREVLDEILYVLDADRAYALYMAAGETVTWPGSTTAGRSGILAATGNIVLRPFLRGPTNTPAQVTSGALGNNQVIFKTFTSVTGGVNPHRAYGMHDNATLRGANKVSVKITGSAGAALSCAVTGTPADNVEITVDTTATTLTALVSYLTNSADPGPAAFRALGLVASVEATSTGSNLVSTLARTYLTGALDAEEHSIPPSALSNFFADTDNCLAEGDTVCIAYSKITEYGGVGGRRQSMVASPENSATLAAANLFLPRRKPELIANAIPLCTVLDNRLIFLNGLVLEELTTTDVMSHYVRRSGDTLSGTLIVSAASGYGVSATGAGTDPGLRGVGGSSGAYGVKGEGAGTSAGVHGTGGAGGASHGVEGVGRDTGAGVYGTNAYTSGAGVKGLASNTSGTGVRGEATATSGVGVAGVSTSHIGVVGTGANRGIDGDAGSGSGNGIRGWGGLTAGTGVVGFGGTGGAGIAGSGDGAGVGVSGYSTGSGAGIDGSSASGYGVKATGNATRAPLRVVPQASAPSTPSPGDVYYNSGDNKLYVWNNSSWIALH